VEPIYRIGSLNVVSLKLKCQNNLLGVAVSFWKKGNWCYHAMVELENFIKLSEVTYWSTGVAILAVPLLVRRN